MKLKVDRDEPYGDLICAHIKKMFPDVAEFSQKELIDALTDVLIGTKESRYGSLPSPESLVVIREAIRESVKKQVAIPVLVPWGSMKPSLNSQVDIAELWALQRLLKTVEQVKKYYAPGLEIVLRVEDTSGYMLFGFDMDQEVVNHSIDAYCEDLQTLVKILSPDGTVRIARESDMAKVSHFNGLVKELTPYFFNYLSDSATMIQFAPEKVKELQSYKNLNKLGWLGTISFEQRSHYYESYGRLYKDEDITKLEQRLALYMAQALARRKLDMSGKQSYWDKFIQITFVQPIKGLPEGYHGNVLYYRTIPMSSGRTHISPWRAKGYLKINGNSICPKLTSFNDADTINSLIPMVLQIVDEAKGLSVYIRTDYLLES